MAVELTGNITNATSEEAAYARTNARIDNIIANGTPTEGNTELIDIRTGAYGTTYSTAGEAVRTQINNLNENIGVVSWAFKVHGYYDITNGQFKNVTRFTTGYASLSVSEGDTFIYRGKGTGDAASVLYYDANNNYVGGEQYSESDYHEITIPSGVTKVIFASNYDTSVSNKLVFELYRREKIIGQLYNDVTELHQDISNIAEQTSINTNGIGMTGALSYKDESQNGYYIPNGTYKISDNFRSGSVVVNVSEGDRFLYRGEGGGSGVALIMYDSEDNIVGTPPQWNSNKYHEVTIPSGVEKVLFTAHRDIRTTDRMIFEVYRLTDIVGWTYNNINEINNSITEHSIVNSMLGAIAYTNSALNGFYKPDGTFANSNNYACGYVTVEVNEGDTFLYKGRGIGNAVSVIFYDSSDNIVTTYQYDETSYHDITIPSGVAKVFFTSYRDKRTTSKLTFELYGKGAIQTFNKKQNLTLNSANRLYASTTLGQAISVKPLEKAVVCIGFDDYNQDCLQGVQYLNSQNLKSYLAVIPDKVTDNWNMAHVCYDNGGEIAAHSNTTLTSENQTFELMNEKFIQIPTIIGQHGFPVYGIIRAGGDNVGAENRSLDEFYCRAAGLKYSDYYGTVNPYRLTRENMTYKTLAEWQTYFDNLVTNKKYVILYCHHLNGTEKNAYTNGFTLLDFKNIVSEIQNRDIDVMTINEFVDRYIYGISGTDAFTR